MLTKIKNTKVNYIGRVLVLPLAVLVFAAFTFKVNKLQTHLYNGKKVTVVIDAGHGGEKDLGATGLDGTTEKELNLTLAKRIKEINTNSNIEIVLTRETDIYQTPQEKADFANNLGAHLLVALHIDKDPKPNGVTKSGMNIFVAKNDYKNATLSKAFGSFMLQSFTSNYQLPVPGSTTQRDVGIWIIKASNCPSILVEAGYINNEKDLAYLKSDEGQIQFSKNILNGIENFLAQPPLITTNTDTIPNKLPTQAQWEKAADKKPSTDLKPTSSVTISALNGKIDFYGDNKNTILTKDEPLFLLNGNEISKKELDKLDPTTIENIDVLKGASVPVYYGENGKNGIVKISTKGNIVKPKPNVAIALDKMNVLYIGLENPVTVAVSGYKNEDLIVSMKNGSIEGKDGKYIAIVTNANPAEIIIETIEDGERKLLGTQIYRVKHMPDPVNGKNVSDFDIKIPASNIELKATAIEIDGEAKSLGKKPYIEVDGKPFIGELNALPKESIKHIKVITDKKAIGLYGDKAKDGTILITTK